MSFGEVMFKHNASISDAVDRFVAPTNKAAKTGDDTVEKALWQSWAELIKLAAETPHSSQDRLGQLIQELRKAPSPKNEDGELIQIWGESLEWKKLSLLGPSLRESWNDTPDGSKPGDDDSWVNRNAFVARLTALSDPSDPLDLSLYGIWALRSALEDQSTEEEAPSKPILEAAAVWMLYAARTLHERSSQGQVFDGKMAREGESLSGKNWRGFNQERWSLWREKMGLAEERCKDRGTRELVAEALTKMGEF